METLEVRLHYVKEPAYRGPDAEGERVVMSEVVKPDGERVAYWAAERLPSGVFLVTIETPGVSRQASHLTGWGGPLGLLELGHDAARALARKLWHYGGNY